MSLVLHLDGRPIAATIAARRPSLRLRVGSGLYDIVELDTTGAAGRFAFALNGRRIEGWRYLSADAMYVRIEGRTHLVRRQSADSGERASRSGASQVVAAFPGVVVAVHCREGDEVKAGERLLTTESMKLQVTHVAPRDGCIAKVCFAADASFDKGAVLVALAEAPPD